MVIVSPGLAVAGTCRSTWYGPPLKVPSGASLALMITWLTLKLSFTVALTCPPCRRDMWSGAVIWIMLGGVLSMLTVTADVHTFPAPSTAWPGTLWFCPSVLITAVGGQLATPERLSLQL